MPCADRHSTTFRPSSLRARSWPGETSRDQAIANHSPASFGSSRPSSMCDLSRFILRWSSLVNGSATPPFVERRDLQYPRRKKRNQNDSVRSRKHTATDGSRHRFSPIRNLKLSHDVVHVMAHRVVADVQSTRDLLVGGPLGEPFENLHFTGSQVGPHHSICEPGSDVARNVTLSRIDNGNRRYHLRLRRIFQQISLSTRTNRAIDIFIFFEARQNDHLRRRLHSFESVQDTDPIHARHPKIKQKQIRVVLLNHSQSFFAAGCGSNHLQPRLGTEHIRQAGTNNRVVVHNQNPYEVTVLLRHGTHAPKGTSKPV